MVCRKRKIKVFPGNNVTNKKKLELIRVVFISGEICKLFVEVEVLSWGICCCQRQGRHHPYFCELLETESKISFIILIIIMENMTEHVSGVKLTIIICAYLKESIIP